MRFRCPLAVWLTVLLIAPGGVNAGIACMDREGGALPDDAYPVPVSLASRMQSLLDVHGRIRLDPGGDYRRATGIILRRNQAVFGAAGTRMGRLIVEPGTSGAVLSGVIPDALEFPPSRLRTHDNCFERFGARVTAQQPLRLSNSIIENNLFLDAGSIDIDTSGGGSVANNRFIRTLVHGTWPALRVQGRDRNSQDRNVFLWMNVLGPHGDGIILRRQKELNIVAFDAEHWNQSHQGRMPAMLSASEIGTLRTFIAHGGDPKADPDAFMDIEASRLELTAAHLIRAAEPAIRLHGLAELVDLQSAGVTFRNDDVGSRLVAFRNWESGIETRKADAHAATSNSSRPWELPSLAAIPAAAGDDWRIARLSAPDMRAALQERIDREGIVVLPAGVHVISGPLRLRNGQGIIGAGAGRTALVARTDDIDLLVSAEHADEVRSTAFVLIDITLQGGRAGIRHEQSGAGPGAQFNLIHLSHVVLRDMSEAGIVIDGIYGWDNNLIDNVSFLDMPVGVRQVPNPGYAGPVVDGDIPGMNYMDKNVFYRCRFSRVGIGLQLLAKRANGLNACIACRFENYSISALELENNLSTLIANTDFFGAGSGPIIRSNQLVGIAGSRFSEIPNVATVLDTDAACEDCRVTAAAGGRPLIFAAGRKVSLANSDIGNAVFPARGYAVLLDTRAETPSGPGTVRALSNGAWQTLAGGAARPNPSLLVEWSQ